MVLEQVENYSACVPTAVIRDDESMQLGTVN